MVRSARIASILTAFVVTLAATPVAADEHETLEELLIEKGFITEAELEEAQADAAAKKAAGTEPAEAKAAKAAKKEEPKFIASVGSKGLNVESADGAFKVGVGGRIQYDAGGFSGGLTPMGAGGQLRRARIVTRGTVWTDWDYKLEVNFDNDGAVAVTDGWVRYTGFEPYTVTLGNQKVPFSQQSMTSSNWQVFQERGLPDAFIDNDEQGRRRLGGVIGSYGTHWNAAVGAFGADVDASTNGNNEDWGVASRIVAAPIVGPARLLTLGGSIYYRDFESTDGLQIRSRPEANLASYRLVDTGTTTVGGQSNVSRMANATDSIMYNIESSFVWNAFHAQGEYTGATVDRIAPWYDLTIPQTTLHFDGWYVQAGWFITGESRAYDMRTAQFKRISPKRKIGAWEVALRLSAIDLESQEILGGKEKDVTVALNWWVNENVMFRFNYVRAMLEPTTAYLPAIPNSGYPGPPTVQAPGAGQDQSINAFMGRVQIVF